MTSERLLRALGRDFEASSLSPTRRTGVSCVHGADALAVLREAVACEALAARRVGFPTPTIQEVVVGKALALLAEADSADRPTVLLCDAPDDPCPSRNEHRECDDRETGGCCLHARPLVGNGTKGAP